MNTAVQNEMYIAKAKTYLFEINDENSVSYFLNKTPTIKNVKFDQYSTLNIRKSLCAIVPFAGYDILKRYVTITAVNRRKDVPIDMFFCFK